MFHRKKVLSVSLIGLVLFALIGGAVMMIIVPAVQSAREDARLNQCAKNMYELARAAKQYDDNHAGLPPITSNSDGFYASWAALIAPYAEQTPSMDLAEPGNSAGNLKIIQSYNSPVWQCPSRRSGQLVDFAASFSTNGTGTSFDPSLPTDYAPGHTTTAEVWNVHADGLIINPLSPATEAAFPVSAVKYSDVQDADGTSYTALLGEKHMRPSWLGSTISDEDQRGLDIPALIAADSAASIRLAGDRLSFGVLPLAPHPEWGLADNPHAASAFGSWHLNRSQFAKADSSVRAYSTETDPIVLRQLLSRDDGKEEPADAEAAPDAAQ